VGRDRRDDRKGREIQKGFRFTRCPEEATEVASRTKRRKPKKTRTSQMSRPQARTEVSSQRASRFHEPPTRHRSEMRRHDHSRAIHPTRRHRSSDRQRCDASHDAQPPKWETQPSSAGTPCLSICTTEVTQAIDLERIGTRKEATPAERTRRTLFRPGAPCADTPKDGVADGNQDQNAKRMSEMTMSVRSNILYKRPAPEHASPKESRRAPLTSRSRRNEKRGRRAAHASTRTVGHSGRAPGNRSRRGAQQRADLRRTSYPNTRRHLASCNTRLRRGACATHLSHKRHTANPGE